MAKENEKAVETNNAETETEQKKAERKTVNWKKVGIIAGAVVVGGALVVGGAYLITRGRVKPVVEMAEAAAEVAAAVV